MPLSIPMPVNSAPPRPNDGFRPASTGTNLVARLWITGTGGEPPVVNPASTSHFPYGEGSPFITGTKVGQRDNGLTAAILGEPGMVAEGTGHLIRDVDANGLLDLYQAEGTRCVERLRGRWAVAICDPPGNTVVLASDRMGRQPLYFRIGRDSVLVGDRLESLRALAGPADLDTQLLYNYIYFHVVPSPGAVEKRFHKLGAAHLLELTPGGHSIGRHWTPAFSESPGRSRSGARAELQQHLRTAVRRCVPDQDEPGKGPKVGAFLSGGLDSSTVAGMLAELQGGSCDAYAIGFDAEGYDEMGYARLTARHFGIDLHEYYVTPEDVVDALPGIAGAFDEPFGNSSALPAYFCARMAAADGIDIMLAGDGGDELFAGNSRYAHQAMFELYHKAPGWLREQVIEPFLNVLPPRLPLVSRGRSFLRQSGIPLPARLHYYSFLEQHQPDEVFAPGFLHQVDTARPLALLEDIYKTPEGASALNRMLFLDWQITLADNDLTKVTRACAIAGVGVRYPMLDDDLVTFSTSIPSDWKLRGNPLNGYQVRDFYKRALKGWLPDETINKRKHGFGLPFGLWMRDHKLLRELAYDSIHALKQRGIFLPQFLDQAIASHRNEHAAYFGELIWILTSLELWLTANHPAYFFGRDS